MYKEMLFKLNYKNVKIIYMTSLPIAMYLVKMAQVKITLLWWLRKTSPLKKISSTFHEEELEFIEFIRSLLPQKEDGLVHNIHVLDS